MAYDTEYVTVFNEKTPERPASSKILFGENLAVWLHLAGRDKNHEIAILQYPHLVMNPKKETFVVWQKRLMMQVPVR